MNLMKYDLIILDCDGVIFNSNLLKIEAFKVSLEDFDNKAVLSFIEYLKKNFGSSRSKLIRVFIEDFLKISFDKILFQVIFEKYSKCCVKLYRSAEFTKDLIKFLGFYGSKKLYIASGSDQKELIEVFESRGLSKYFIEIHGSPELKTDIVFNITSANDLMAVLIGDAEADKLAAENSNIDFIFMKDYSTNNDMIKDKNLVSIKNLGELL